MDRSEFTECLIEELRKLVGWGATAQRLPHQVTLREALGVSFDDGCRKAGYEMRKRLHKAIREIDGWHEIQGVQRPPLVIRIALQILLRYDKWGKNAPDRRTEVSNLLLLGIGHEQMRRPMGPERELLMILAEYLTPPEAAAA